MGGDRVITIPPRGLLCLNTINLASLGAKLAGKKWRRIASPHHLQYFTKKSLRKLLSDYGFRIISQQDDGICFSAGANVVGLKGKINSFLRYWRIRGLVSKLNLLDEITIFAVKND